jgi:hypothetical protein
MGSGSTGGAVLNADSKVGNLYSRGAIRMRDRAQVRGSIFAGSTITKGNSTSVLGLTFPSFAFDPPGHFAWKVDVPPANTLDVRLEPDRQQTLAPGRYRTVSIKSRSAITISAGDYFIDALEVLEPQAKLKIDTSAGKVKLYVMNSMTFRGALENVNDPSKSDLLIVMLGSGTVLLEQPYSGFLIAPSAKLQFRQTNSAHNGAFFAKSIVSDAGAIFRHRPFDFADFFPSDILVITPQDRPPGEPGAATDPVDEIVTDLGLPPGQRACDPGLVLDSELEGIQASTTVHYRDEPTAPSTCVVDYQECTDAETGADNPTEAELNEQPALDSTCPGSASSQPCGVEPSTITWDDEFGLCQTDADCALYGKVCASVCLMAGCTGSEDCIDPLCEQGPVRRCAKLSTSCSAEPTEGPCQVLRECAEPDASGDSDPNNHSLTGQPPSNIDEPPADTPPPSTIGPTRPGSYADEQAVCTRIIPPKLGPALQPEPESRDMIAGNDKWGIIAKPTMSFSGEALPKPFSGEASINAKGEAGLNIAVRLWGKDYTVFNASGSAEFSTCKAQLTRSLVLVGRDIDPGGGDDEPANDRTNDCNGPLNRLEARLDTLKAAQAEAINVKKFADCLGPQSQANVAKWNTFCQNAASDLAQRAASDFEGFTFPSACTGTNPGPAMAAAWQDVYRHLRDQQVADIANIANIRKQVYDAIGGSPLTFLDIDQSFTGFKFDFTYPVGPVTVSIDIELGGGWGVSGDLAYAAEAPPNAKLEATASLRPRFDTTVIIFAGIGIGPVVVGVEGELLLLEVQTPLQAGVTLRQVAVADTRTPFYAALSSTAKSAFAAPANAPAGFVPFGPTLFDWDAEWSYGAGVHLESLSGQIDLAAKIKLLFFTKKWKKKLAKWDALFTLDKSFTGRLETRGDEQVLVPESDEPGLGTFYEGIPLVDPNFVKTNTFQQPGANCMEPDLGPCVIIK